jgi:hypothetical protein
MPVVRLLQANFRIPYFIAAMLFGGLANGFFFFAPLSFIMAACPLWMSVQGIHIPR